MNQDVNIEHKNAERIIFSYLCGKRSCFINFSGSVRKIKIKKVIWEERVLKNSFSGRKWRCDMVLIDVDDNVYVLEIINTNKPNRQKIDDYILSNVCGIYIDIKNIISTLPLKKHEKAIISNIERYGFQSFF